MRPTVSVSSHSHHGRPWQPTNHRHAASATATTGAHFRRCFHLHPPPARAQPVTTHPTPATPLRPPPPRPPSMAFRPLPSRPPTACSTTPVTGAGSVPQRRAGLTARADGRRQAIVGGQLSGRAWVVAPFEVSRSARRVEIRRAGDGIRRQGVYSANQTFNYLLT